tara:strand:+ start:1576 stop:2034 length:459 start_codon:yes stop_codon:yes gene_type:complete
MVKSYLELIMIKKIIILFIFLSFNVFSHSVKEGDMDGSWRVIEAFINGEKQENHDGLMVSAEGFSSINWTGADGNKYFNYSSYEVKDGLVHVEILNHTLDEYIGAKFSHQPNFMGDKKSYISTFTWDDVEYTHRWEKVSCAYEKCARISDFR